MDIDISVAACLNLFRRQEKLQIQFFIQLVENKTSFGGNKCRIRVGIFLVTDIHDGLGFLVNIVKHSDKILLVVTIIPVTLCNNGLNLLENFLNNVVHFGNGNLIFGKGINLGDDKLADFPVLIIGKLGKSSVCTLSDRINDLLNIKNFSGSVFFDYKNFRLRLIDLSVINAFSHDVPPRSHFIQ